MEEYFWEKVEKTAYCWIWKGPRLKTGYGRFWTGKKMIYSHRFSYELTKGNIPYGLEIDHLCENRMCVNPAHLEAVTHRTNMRRSKTCISTVNFRKTHCSNGHEFNVLNTKINKNRGTRMCKICIKNNLVLRSIKRKQERKEKRGLIKSQKTTNSFLSITAEQLELRKKYYQRWISSGKRTHCKNGHELGLENICITRKGGRLCLICESDYNKTWKKNKRLKNKNESETKNPLLV